LKIVDEIYDEICSTYKHIYPRSFEVEILKDSIQNYEIDRNYARENALNQLEKNKNNLNYKQCKEAIEEIDDFFKTFISLVIKNTSNTSKLNAIKTFLSQCCVSYNKKLENILHCESSLNHREKQ
ncbi:24402_t:CDS:1, partial [Gigaspora margarita]